MQIGTSESRAISPFVRNPKSKINYGLKKNKPAREAMSDFSNSNLNFSKQMSPTLSRSPTINQSELETQVYYWAGQKRISKALKAKEALESPKKIYSPE